MGIQQFKFLAKELPGFKVHSSQIKILHEPKHFYQELLNRSLASQNRIVISALYWGTEEKEKRLVEAVGDSMKRNTNMRVKILLDWCRGTRMVKGESSASILAQLKTKASERCRVSFYLTPYLKGWWGRMVPRKWNETVGLQHCKVYVFDDSLVISGANLSKDYFTERQDRYVIIEDCPALADYYEGLVDTVDTFSLGMDREGVFTTQKAFANLGIGEFVDKSSVMVKTFLEKEKTKNAIDFEHVDAVVFPTVQMGQLHVNQDSRITSKILRSGEQGGMFHFATGYFNLTEDYMRDLLDMKQSSYTLLMAHPKANGFLGARGPPGGIPHAYTLIASKFWQWVQQNSLQHRITLFEYLRQGWTFHAKGLWYSSGMSISNMPCLTMVGSPNFGYRSVYRDLETQVTILTTNKELQERMGKEQKLLYKQGQSVNSSTFTQEDRLVPTWVKMVVWLGKKFF